MTFKVGQKVRVIDAMGSATAVLGEIVKVLRVDPRIENLPEHVVVKAQDGRQYGMFAFRFEALGRGLKEVSPERRREIARKGGLATAKNREHMSRIGRKGGHAVAKDRAHMARIGRKGGSAPRNAA